MFCSTQAGTFGRFLMLAACLISGPCAPLAGASVRGPTQIEAFTHAPIRVTLSVDGAAKAGLLGLVESHHGQVYECAAVRLVDAESGAVLARGNWSAAGLSRASRAQGDGPVSVELKLLRNRVGRRAWDLTEPTEARVELRGCWPEGGHSRTFRIPATLRLRDGDLGDLASRVRDDPFLGYLLRSGGYITGLSDEDRYELIALAQSGDLAEIVSDWVLRRTGLELRSGRINQLDSPAGRIYRARVHAYLAQVEAFLETHPGATSAAAQVALAAEVARAAKLWTEAERWRSRLERRWPDSDAARLLPPWEP